MLPPNGPLRPLAPDSDMDLPVRQLPVEPGNDIPEDLDLIGTGIDRDALSGEESGWKVDESLVLIGLAGVSARLLRELWRERTGFLERRGGVWNISS